MSNQAQHYTIRVEQVAWSVEQLLGLFLEDIYGEGGDHAEPARSVTLTAMTLKIRRVIRRSP